TQSQRCAYEAIRGQKVTAVWGPPGTGKTHFLASAILGLTAAHLQVGQPFRVLVTAYTHAAIENLLRKIAKQAREWKKVRMDLRLGKAKYWQGGEAPMDVVAEDDLGEWLRSGQHAVVGATLFSCLKKHREWDAFDLVVIDEASQA